jgi:hypothetical protein
MCFERHFFGAKFSGGRVKQPEGIFARDVLPNQASVTKSKGTVWWRIA